MTARPAVHRALADPQRVALLAALETAGPLDAGELGRRVGLHANTVRWHLGILEDARLVVSGADRRGVPGRPRRVWEAQRVHDDAAEQVALSRTLVSIVARSRHAREECEEAGRAWGRRVAGRSRSEEGDMRRLVHVLEEHGLEPQAQGLDVTMTRCPFADLARESPEVVCGIHRGLVEGVLEEAGSALAVERLDVFPRPGVCVLGLVETA
jgi:predicted ArsR family transcriptional regulator